MKKYIFPSVVILMVIIAGLSFGYKKLHTANADNGQGTNTIQTGDSVSSAQNNWTATDSKQNTSDSQANAKKNTVKPGKILSVNDIQADPSSFTGTITINGVMAGVSQTDSKLFGLVDTAEVKACQSVGCGTFILPVKYDGKLPQVGDDINVTGSFVGGGNDLVFKATAFKVLSNILPKGGK